MTRPALHAVRAHTRKSPKRKSVIGNATHRQLMAETGFKPRVRVKAEARPAGRS